jgi:hypothetical protein
MVACQRHPTRAIRQESEAARDGVEDFGSALIGALLLRLALRPLLAPRGYGSRSRAVGNHMTGSVGLRLSLFRHPLGEPRIAQVMNKPFADCSREMELPFDLSVSGMRRTYHDLAQAAGVKDLVIRSISGHQDAKMQAHYTSHWGPRQLEALDAIMGLVTGKHRRVFVTTADSALITAGEAPRSDQ